MCDGYKQDMKIKSLRFPHFFGYMLEPKLNFLKKEICRNLVNGE
jgi:hypothetical protein